MHRKIYEGAEGDNGCKWILGRRDPDNYAERREISVQGEDHFSEMSTRAMLAILGPNFVALASESGDSVEGGECGEGEA